MRRKIEKLLVLLLVVLLAAPVVAPKLSQDFDVQETATAISEMGKLPQDILDTIQEPASEPTATPSGDEADATTTEIPEYSGEPYSIINNNIPFFTETTTECFEEYPELDSLGRCGAAYACVGIDTMPTEERESISEVKPSGWHNKPYDFVDGGCSSENWDGHSKRRPKKTIRTWQGCSVPMLRHYRCLKKDIGKQRSAL